MYRTKLEALPAGKLSSKDAAWLLDELHERMADYRSAARDASGVSEGPRFERYAEAEARLMRVECAILAKLRGER